MQKRKEQQGTPPPPTKVALWLVRVEDTTPLTDAAKRHRDCLGARGQPVSFADELHCTLWFTGKDEGGKAGRRNETAGGADPYALSYKRPVDLAVHFILYGKAHVVAAVSFVGPAAAAVAELCRNAHPHITLWTAPGSLPKDSQSAVAEMLHATGPLDEFWAAQPAGVAVVRKSVGVAVPTPGLTLRGVVDVR